MRTNEDNAGVTRGYVDLLAGRGFVVEDPSSVPAGAGRLRRTRYGRVRMTLSGTRVRATVGPRTVTFHRCEGRGLAGVTIIATVETSDGRGMEDVLSRLPPVAGRDGA